MINPKQFAVIALFTLCVLAPAAWGGEARPRVLVIASAEDREAADFLVDLLRKHNVAFEVRLSDRLFKSLDELKPYAAVILADVPHTVVNGKGSRRRS